MFVKEWMSPPPLTPHSQKLDGEALRYWMELKSLFSPSRRGPSVICKEIKQLMGAHHSCIFLNCSSSVPQGGNIKINCIPTMGWLGELYAFLSQNVTLDLRAEILGFKPEDGGLSLASRFQSCYISELQPPALRAWE